MGETSISKKKKLDGDESGKFTSYIRNNLTQTMIKFPVTPTNISESVSANFTQQDIIGASIPRIVYSNTSAQTMTLSLQNLTSDYVQLGFDNLLSYVRAIQALAYPSYSGGIVKSPDLTLVLGRVSYSCVCTNVSVSWSEDVINTGGGSFYKSCNIDLQLLITRNSVPGATEIENSIDGDS
jgi:hypothetical protein